MIEAIRLFRKKEDDIWAIFLVEFFKFIGCIVSDYILPDDLDNHNITKGIYDVDIFLNLDKEKYEEIKIEKKEEGSNENIIFVSTNESVNDISLETMKICGKNILYNQIIDKIWEDQNDIKSLKCLSNAYCTSNIFYYLYNKGNLKWIQEFYSIHKTENESKKITLKNAYKRTFSGLAICYNCLNEYESKECTISPYYRYALLKIKYKLNEMSISLEDNKIFDTIAMLKEIDTLRKSFPTFIRINYLGAKICSADSRYLWSGEIYYFEAIEKAKKLYPDSFMEEFIYYQLGRYYEKIRQDEIKAYRCYELSYRSNCKAYRTMYKIAINLKRNNKYKEAINLINDTIVVLLSKYKMESMMPKQQIYAYKCFVLLGDIYNDIEYYDLSTTCYELSIAIANTKSHFHTLDISGKDKCFKELISLCMPQQPVFLKLINCAAKYNDEQKIQEYFWKLKNMNI